MLMWLFFDMCEYLNLQTLSLEIPKVHTINHLDIFC